MSFRPTIAVRFGAKIADIGYYRNWQEPGLLIEAAALAAAYMDCRSVREVRDRAFGTQNVSYVVSPELFPNTQKNLRMLESCSELPINVDLKARCIYCSYGALSREELKKLPRARADRRGIWHTDFYRQLEGCRLPFGKIDLEEVREMILGDPDLQSLLSERTLKALKKSLPQEAA